MEQGQVIKSGKEQTFTKAQMEEMLRERDLMNQQRIAELVQKQVSDAMAKGGNGNVAAVAAAVAQGISQANSTNSDHIIKQKGIQGDIPYKAKDADLLEESVTYMIPQFSHLIWPETVNGKLLNSPTGGAAIFEFFTIAQDGEDTLV